MMILISHSDGIVSKKRATYPRLSTQAPRYTVHTRAWMYIFWSLERDLNREPWLVAPKVNSKMSKLNDEDRGRWRGWKGADAIRGNDLFTRVGRVMN